jgi:lysine 2,3-aminomutase
MKSDSSVVLKPWGKISRRNWQDWKWQFRNSIRTLPQLAEALNKPAHFVERYKAVVDPYHFCVSPYYFSLMNVRDETDPIRRQCFPDMNEIHYSLGSMVDPLKEKDRMPVWGLVHRYPDRCLAITTNICATYCRHCNRKGMWRLDQSMFGEARLKAMVEYVSRVKNIREVIVSGGDPLTVNEQLLDWFLWSLRSIPHVEVLRIGSRMPVVVPMRITRRICTMLRKHRPLWFNTQFNHPHEITEASAKACEMLLDAGIPVSNQSVLLRGINDNYDTMKALLHGLQRISVRPYYIFQCDPVAGTDHFRADLSSGLSIMEKLQDSTSGLCVPQYVLDTPGGRGKVSLREFSELSGKEIKEGIYEHFFDKVP